MISHSTERAEPEIHRPMRIRELDALRGIAALVVVLHHLMVIFYDEIFGTFNGWFLDLLVLIQFQNKGAVLTFFVLSGYAIGLATRKRPPVTGPELRDYAQRRALRILPLYYFSLIWTFGLGLIYGLDRPSFSVETLIGNFFFLQTSASAKGVWFEPFGENGPYWSLSYEFFYYLLLPPVLFVIGRKTSSKQAFLVAIALLGALLGLVVGMFMPIPFTEFLTLWVVWILGYVAVDLRRGLASIMLLSAPLVVFSLVSLGLASFGETSSSLPLMIEGCGIGFVFGLIALYPEWTSFAPVSAFRRALIRLFANIGDGSYALYLLHFPLLLALHELLTAPFGNLTWWVAGFGFVLFVIVACPGIEKQAQHFSQMKINSFFRAL